MNDSQSKTAGSEVLLPCPFCGASAFIRPVARSWWKIVVDHTDDCILSGRFDDAIVPQCDEDKAGLVEDWNARATLSHPATQAGALQAVVLTDAQIESIYHRYGGDMINCARSIERAALAALAATQPNAAPAAEVVALDRSKAVNLARNMLTVRDCKGITAYGVRVLCEAVMSMDAALAAPGAAIDAREQEVRLPRGEADYALMNRIMDLSCKAANASAKANSDDGAEGTEATAQFLDLRREIWTLIANKQSEQAALASRSEAPEARPNAAGQEHEIHRAWALMKNMRNKEAYAILSALVGWDPVNSVPISPPLEAVGSSGMTADHAQGDKS